MSIKNLLPTYHPMLYQNDKREATQLEAQPLHEGELHPRAAIHIRHCAGGHLDLLSAVDPSPGTSILLGCFLDEDLVVGDLVPFRILDLNSRVRLYRQAVILWRCDNAMTGYSPRHPPDQPHLGSFCWTKCPRRGKRCYAMQCCHGRRAALLVQTSNARGDDRLSKLFWRHLCNLPEVCEATALVANSVPCFGFQPCPVSCILDVLELPQLSTCLRCLCLLTCGAVRLVWPSLRYAGRVAWIRGQQLRWSEQQRLLL